MAMPAILRNPIFQKDFVSLCRTKRWFVLRTVVIALLVAALWLALYASSFERHDSLDRIGPLLVRTLAVVELILICLLVPGLVSDLIVGERRKETLEILLVTSLRPLGILLGKFLSRVALVIVLVAASFPLLAISLLYGGVRGEQLVALFLVFAGTVLLLAGAGLLVSTWARRLGTAAVLSYVLPLAWFIAEPVLVFALSAFRTEEAAFGFLTRTHPLFATIAVAWEDMYLGYRQAGAAPWETFALIASAFGVLCIGLAWFRLHRERRTRGFGGRPIDRNAEAIADLTRLRDHVTARIQATTDEALRAPLAALRPEIEACLADLDRPGGGTVAGKVRDLEERVRALGLARDPGIRAGTERARTGRRRRALGSRLKSPMLWKELHLVNASHSRVLFYACAGILVLTTGLFFALVEGDIREGLSHLALATSEAFVLLVLVTVNSATTIVGEREQGTLDLVHVTLVTPSEIVYAKALGTLRSVLFLALIPVAHLFFATTCSDLPVAGAVVWTIILLVMLAFFTAAGLSASIAATRPSRAILRSIAIFAAVVFGPPLVWTLLMIASDGRADDFAGFWLMADPFSLLGAVPAFTIPSEYHWDNPSGTDSLYLIYAGLWGMLYLGATGAWFAALPHRYRAHRRKLEGGHPE